MSTELARSHYIGKPGFRKFNCAQAVAYAFKDQLELSEDIVQRFEGCGGGRAPDGQCGALYAAKVILERSHPDRIKDCEDALLVNAGSITCRDIRSFRKLSCLGCVEKVAESIDKVIEGGRT